jgi:cob(I)alamin adenosyltransferase
VGSEIRIRDKGKDAAVAYLKRLSDALLVWARVVNKREGVREEAPSY